MDVRAVLEELERSSAPGDLPVQLAYLAGLALELDEGELRGPLRRALLLLATGGDPRRELDPDGREVRAVADDLDTPDRRARLGERLEELGAAAAGLDAVAAAIGELRRDEALAWRLVAAGLLADELSDTPNE